MTWVRRWTLNAPGSSHTKVGVDDRSSSLLIADGWGVAFAALAVRRVDADSGRVLANVRTRTPIRAFGRATTDDALFFVGNTKLFEHDAATLERRSVCDHRVPRYCYAIVDVGGGAVALAAPKALIEYDRETSRTRRAYGATPAVLGCIDRMAICLAADGTILRRTT